MKHARAGAGVNGSHDSLVLLTEDPGLSEGRPEETVNEGYKYTLTLYTPSVIVICLLPR